MKSSPARSRPGSAARPARARSAAPAGDFALLARFDRGDFPATLYIDGPSEALKAALLAELRAAWTASGDDAPAPRVFRTAETSVEALLATFHGTSLFATRELSLVLEVEDFGRSEKRVAALAAGLARPSGASSMVLVESESDTPRKLLDPLRSACAVRWKAEPPGRADLLAWGARRFQRHSVAAEAGAIDAVVDACEGEALAFFSELSKLEAYAGGTTLTRQQVTELLRPVVGADLPEYLSAVALGFPGLAAQRLSRLLVAGVSEGQVMFGLANLVGGALGGWAKFREPSAALGRRLTPRALARALDAVYRCEAAWKGGRADVIAALEQATRSIAARG